MKSFLLLFLIFKTPAYAACMPTDALGNLNWGAGAVPGPSCKIHSKSASDFQKLSATDPLAKLSAGLLAKAKTELSDPIPVVAALNLQGHLSSEPAYQQSIAATSALSKVLHFSFCARLAQPALSDQCKEKAVKSILLWTQTYQPTGDPINESSLIPLLKSIDLMLPLLDQTVGASVKSWVKKLISQGDQFFQSQMKGHGTEHNNWNTWRLANRAIATSVLGDKSLMSETAGLIHEQAKFNFVRDTNGKTDGATADFVERDALHYHIYDLSAWATIASFTPCLLNDEDQASLRAGIDFLKPFYLGQKQHLEFKNSKVAFDAKRAQAGDPTYQVHTWVPTGGSDDGMNRGLIRLARPSFSEIQLWTNAFVTPAYDPTLKLEAKLLGEPIDSN